MIYISKGIVKENSTEQRVTVCYGGGEFVLTGNEARIWLDGRYGIAQIPENAADSQIGHLHRMGLVETEYENTAVAKYRLLTKCVFVPSQNRGLGVFRSQTEKQILFWLRNAGIRLTTAELV